MPLPFDSAVFILIILSQELWREAEQFLSVNLHIRVLLVTEYVSQHHLCQQDQGLGPRRSRVRPCGPLVASQDQATQTAAATSTTGDPEVPVPHTEAQRDSGYGSPGLMSPEEQRPADVAGDVDKAEGAADDAEGVADNAEGHHDAAGGQGL